MVVQVMGKEHAEGVSKKTGNKYSFNKIHTFAKQKGVEGTAAVQKIIDPDVIPYEEILVGSYYELEADMDGNIISFRHVDKKV